MVRSEHMYASDARPPLSDYRLHSHRRRRSLWPARLVRSAAILMAVATLSLGLARVAEGGVVGSYETVTVQPGETLWSIAAARYPGSDIRTRVFQIEEANHLAGPSIDAGEQLRVPAR